MSKDHQRQQQQQQQLIYPLLQASGIAAIRNLLRVSPESIAAEIIETAGVEALVELRRLVGAPGEPWSAAAAAAAAAATDSSDAMRLQVRKWGGGICAELLIHKMNKPRGGRGGSFA